MLLRTVALVITMALAILTIWAETIAAGANVRMIVLISDNVKPYEEALEGFKGYLCAQRVEAQFDVFPLEGDPAKASKALENTNRGNANLILALGSVAASAAVKASPDIPIIAGLILNVDDLKAGTNLTGVSLEFPLEVQFRWLSRMLPGCKKIGALYNPAQNLKKIESATKIAGSMGLKLYTQKVESPSDIPYALETLSNKVDALWGMIDDVVYTPQTAKQILLFSFREKIPFIGISREWVKAGALYALVCDYKDLGAQCGENAQKILQGAHSSSSALEFPRKVACALNLKTAGYMQIEIKEELVQSSQEVFK